MSIYSIYRKKAKRPNPARQTEITAQYQDSSFIVRRRKRFWEVVDQQGELVCLTVYKRGAFEVVRRLGTQPNS